MAQFIASAGSCDVRPAWTWAYGQALSKEIKYIAEHTTVCLIDLCISASGTGYSGKLFALNIEYFTPKASGGSEHSCFILVILTLRTPVTDIIHELFSFGRLSFAVLLSTLAFAFRFALTSIIVIVKILAAFQGMELL